MFIDGIVLIDKPEGCTSHDVVNRWRRLANTKRVGHLGTLDPMATGLLVLISGRATRLAQFYGKEQKTYIAEVTLGVVSDTYDAEGDVKTTRVPLPDNPGAILEALDEFRGAFMQKPPPFSAKKIKGGPAYKLARASLPVDLEPVEMTISELTMKMLGENKMELTVTSSAGTYIRSLAHDLGQRLGCGAILSSLRRTNVGQYQVADARTLDELGALAGDGHLGEAIIPIGRMLPHFPAQHFDSTAEVLIRQGRDFRTSPFVIEPGAPLVRALSHLGDLIAIGELRLPNVYHPVTVL